MTAPPKSHDYLPVLDGLRAVAILLVIFSHAGFEHIVPGGLGVGIFFVISGFLLTRQMINEIEKTGQLNISRFYLRRFLRLAPALLFYLGLICPILLLMGSPITWVHILSGLSYFANYYHIFVGYPDHSPMPILWSLSVEEHFYLLFPLALVVFRKNLQGIMPWLFIAVTAVLIWRYALFTSCQETPWALCGLTGKERFFGTDTIFDCILYGSITAIGMHYWQDRVRRFFINPTSFMLAAIILLFSLIYRNDLFRETLRFTLQSMSIAVVMLNILFGQWGGPKTILSHSILLLIGRMSYSLYLFHYGALALVDMATHHTGTGLTSPTALASYFLLTLILSAASNQLIEKPMIAVRKKYGGHPAG